LKAAVKVSSKKTNIQILMTGWYCTALLNLLTCILNKKNMALDKKTKVNQTYENLFASTKI